MNNATKVIIVAALVAAVGVALTLKASKRAPPPTQPPNTAPVPAEQSAVSLPKLIDLGAGTCTPCKMMIPIMEELKKEYAGKLDVELIDVSADEAPGLYYGIKLIPTQIFLDKDGKEVFRHEGFFPKDEIEKKLAELGMK